MNKTIARLGLFRVIEGDADGKRCCWVERGGERISGYSSADEANEYASPRYDEYVEDADVSTGE